MFNKFIDRPVLSTVISIIIVILGVLGLYTLPITQYPDIAPPTVQVRATYPGANAETVLKSVIVPIEEKLNGVEGMDYISSTASNSGMAMITVYFKQNYDPDIATVNVQNRVAMANPLLPQEVRQTGVVTQKQQTSSLMYLSFYSENTEHDEDFISNYLNINVVPVLQRVPGVGDVRVYSSKTYAMRIWVDPDKMAMYELEPADIANAINTQSQEAAAGNLGENAGQAFSYTIRYSGRLSQVDEYKNIVLKALGDGNYLRLKDVADINLGVENYGVTTKTAGHPSVSVAIFQTAGSNAREIIQQVHKHFAEFEETMPRGMKINIDFDTNEFLDASISKVVHTLIEAFLLVFLVVFIFLQDFRSTLIPAISVPVSIIGTFFFLNLFGYSVNLLTLFALVLAIGIVVDDAIVVVEAVHAKLDGGEKNPRKASHDAMNEISGAIISITLVMAAVFIPVTFISGPAGVFYKQFGITLMTAILISAINALTLSPALCALLLKPHTEKGKKVDILKGFKNTFNAGFNATLNKYAKSLTFFYRHKWMTPLVIILAGVGIWWTSSTVRSGFVPSEDRAIIMMNVALPEGSSIDATAEINRQLYNKIHKLPGVETVSTTAGYSLIDGQGPNFGLGFIKMKKWDEREADSLSVDNTVKKLFGVAATIPGAKVLFFGPPSIPGFSASGGFEVNLLDKYGGSFDELSEQTKLFLMKLNQRPEIQYASSSFTTNYPQYQMNINVPLAMEVGVNINSIFKTMQGYLGGIYTADFSRFGKQFKVYIQAPPEKRIETSDLNRMYVRTKSGEMAPVSQFVTLKRVYGPQSVTRFNLYNSTKVTGAPNVGYSSGDAIQAIKEVVSEMPANYGIDYSGLTREEVNASGQTWIIFMLVVVFVYFLLSAQYESYLLPLSILLSVPLGIFGAYFTTMMFGLENNIYFQIALIMLIGLLAKNAILIVEFAIQRRRHGESIVDSAIDGAKARLRPILMTSFAFILGLMPLVFANGVGAIGNRSIGTGAVGGLLIGTITAIFVIPTLYIFFQWLQEKVSPPKFDVTSNN
ncbi:MAG: efflux RND transporter permease subunit [Brumimicrobium sp.]|nr:efflux RND transporter permease subunit [Brumimicrobium sp.]